MATKITLRVATSEGKSYTMSCIFHKAEAPNDLLIEEDFYKNFGKDKSVPKGTQYELELVDTAAWMPITDRPPLHIHVSKKANKKHFVCYPSRLASYGEAIELFKVWCVGTVYTLQTRQDFGHLMTGYNFTEFLNRMKDEFKIQVAKVTPEKLPGG
jgi:hypothetical protein